HITPNAATFNFAAMNSHADTGLTPKNVGNARFADQKTGLMNPLPIAKPKISGTATIRTRSRTGSLRANQVTGATIKSNTIKEQTGSNQPLCRHSNQNCAPDGERKSFVRPGAA